MWIHKGSIRVIVRAVDVSQIKKEAPIQHLNVLLDFIHHGAPVMLFLQVNVPSLINHVCPRFS